ncbi:qcr9 subunit 9 of the ubiquinol cytochrome-c reductase complex [Emydomyces testavorans]|uniref:Complex III subunit 9 n=1 Tax=Emydomyces testavorans TaxID=2070801 RepID=A0AAF0IIM0_9EURO|nr:qcr9 subunit 9 of the ubiquinol cytochrome-c reductase complex [Emydomyces testavorans]
MAGGSRPLVHEEESGEILTPASSTFIRRNAVFLSTIFVGAFAFEMAFDTISNSVWDTLNRGRQWKDIKHKYINKEEEE